jgi:5-methylcytosine-specific restriction enzyme A
VPNRPPVHVAPGQKERTKQRQQERQTTEEHRFYMRKEWKNLRTAFVADNPLCKMCLDEDVIRVGQQVDHIIPVRQAPDRALDWTNLQHLCDKHHNQKSRKEQQAMNK